MDNNMLEATIRKWAVELTNVSPDMQWGGLEAAIEYAMEGWIDPQGKVHGLPAEEFEDRLRQAIANL